MHARDLHAARRRVFEAVEERAHHGKDDGTMPLVTPECTPDLEHFDLQGELTTPRRLCVRQEARLVLNAEVEHGEDRRRPARFESSGR